MYEGTQYKGAQSRVRLISPACDSPLDHDHGGGRKRPTTEAPCVHPLPLDVSESKGQVMNIRMMCHLPRPVGPSLRFSPILLWEWMQQNPPPQEQYRDRTRPMSPLLRLQGGGSSSDSIRIDSTQKPVVEGDSVNTFRAV